MEFDSIVDEPTPCGGHFYSHDVLMLNDTHPYDNGSSNHSSGTYLVEESSNDFKCGDVPENSTTL